MMEAKFLKTKQKFTERENYDKTWQTIRTKEQIHKDKQVLY